MAARVNDPNYSAVRLAIEHGRWCPNLPFIRLAGCFSRTALGIEILPVLSART
jgi:hypothetical protein